jgi:protein NrfD
MVEEIILATARHNDKIDPMLGIWGWQIAMYLFLGGITAGIMFFSALVILLKKEEQAPFSAVKLALWGPIALSLGMGCLFLDLEHKLFVYRFYTTFQPSSPMSWGAWILIIVYPVSILLILATLRVGYPILAAYAERWDIGKWVLDTAERYRRAIAVANIPVAVGLGIYTGILLSTFMARPFWNTGVLGPLFLISGLSTAAALVVLVARKEAERHMFTRIDVGLILIELVIIALLVINLATGARMQLEAFRQIFGGAYTVVFWGFFVALGLLIPLVLEYRELKGKVIWVALAPVLVLVGGYVLRQVTVDVGQAGNWTHYATQFNPALLERLHH